MSNKKDEGNPKGKDKNKKEAAKEEDLVISILSRALRISNSRKKLIITVNNLS